MADKLHFDLVSPERRVFAGDVDMVVVPGMEGDFGVLAGHVPFMSTIRTGAISVHSGADVTRTFICGGFAEVTAAGLTILAEEAINLADVNAEETSRVLVEAREDFNQASNDDERHDAQARIGKFEVLLSALTR